MKHLENFNNFNKLDINTPKNEEVDKWIKYLDNKYKVKSNKDLRFIIIDYKSYYLDEPLFNKKRIIQKIFLDIKENEDMKNIHYPSLRKAIKNWLESKKKLN